MLYVLFSALISFWPYMVGYGTKDLLLEHTVLRDTLDNGHLFELAAVAALTLMFPLIIDWLTDMMEHGINITPNRKSFNVVTDSKNINHREKTVLYIGLLSVPAVAFVSCENLALLWFCMAQFQLVSVLGTLAVTFSRIDVDVDGIAWPWWMSLLSTTILTIAVNLSLYDAVVPTNIVATMAVTLKAIVLALMVFSCIRWLRRPTTKSFTALYIFVATICYCMVLIFLMATGSKNLFTPTLLTVYNAAFIFLELGLCYYDLKSTKYERLTDLRALVESRKQYLRYIAHEIRTPLNSACLGLTLMVDALETIEEKDVFDEVNHCLNLLTSLLVIVPNVVLLTNPTLTLILTNLIL